MKNRALPVVLAFLFLPAVIVRAAAPMVAITSPDNGETDVSPEVTEIRIEFDQPMNPGGRSIVGGGDSFPKISGELKWTDSKTMVVPVALEPDHEYHFSINSDTFKGFTSAAGESAEWYPVSFTTRAAGTQPAKPDVTPEQNKAALVTLAKLIDEDYSYRDLRKIDWAGEIAARRAKFENVGSANEFARLTAHLLRLARDAHVSVRAGDVQIGTLANSALPNFNPQVLSQTVPGWSEHPKGLVTGQFDDGIGYILLSACSNDQADEFDSAMNDLKDTSGLIIDARFNGGGDEVAARRVAGWFVQQPAVYSRDRIRKDGVWTDPMDRVIEPRKDIQTYSKPVAVLIGPKVVSSAESFVLMMKFGVGAKLIGGTTGGSSGRPLPHDLGNGVSVFLPSWEDQLPDGNLLQGHGIEPDRLVRTTPRNFQDSDPVLAAGLEYLRKK